MVRKLLPTPILQAPASKIGATPSMDRNIASAAAPQTAGGDLRTEMSTFFTKAGTDPEIIYNGDRLWATVTLELETAGPCSVGTRTQITPVLSGKGLRLQTGQPRSFTIAKGSRLYIASTAISRVSVTIEAIPWLEQITALIIQAVERLGRIPLVGGIFGKKG